MNAKKQAGLNQQEFSIVLVVLGLIWLIGLNRLNELQEISEKTAMDMTISNITSGLRWEMADRIMTARESSIAEMAGSNPIRWLEKKPEDYVGEFSALPDKFPPGGWYFDTQHKELRYRPILQRHLECAQCARTRGDVLLSWRIAPSANPMFGQGARVRIEAMTAYRWF